MHPDTRDHVHALIDQLPASQLAAIETLLESMIGPGEGEDEREVTPEERAAIQAGLDSLEREAGVPMEDVLADFGLTTADFEKLVNER